MKEPRRYRMDVRARAVEETRARIADAMVELTSTSRLSDISLDDVAARAGVSVQTVLRHYGSRSGLITGVNEDVRARIEQERAAPVGDIDRAMGVLVKHYEKRGQMVLLMLAQEAEDPVMAEIASSGRTMHRDWVEAVFAPLLPGDDAFLDLLVIATDVYTWKLLRLDRGLSRSATQQRMVTLVRAVLSAATNTEES